MTVAQSLTSLVGTSSVPDRADNTRSNAFYNKFYTQGGWAYSTWREYWWHRKHFVKRFNLQRGMNVLEIASGCGFHTNLLRRMGFPCVGIDLSDVGVEKARSKYPKCQFHCADFTSNVPVESSSFDVAFTRGFSHYHYDLMSEQAISTTRRVLQFLKPGGLYVMIVSTDLSGGIKPNLTWQNKLEDYRKHFSSMGSDWTADWHKGMAICSVRRGD